jgi:hypothetical protein
MAIVAVRHRAMVLGVGKMRVGLLTSVAVAALALAAQSQNAYAGAPPVLVSTIDGGYDGPVYDTPYLTISNTTGNDFTNVTLTLLGYQGLNNGISQSRNLGTIAAGTVYSYVWLDGYGGTIAGDLFSYDYDDEYGETQSNPACTQPYALCSLVGNFQVTLTATWANPEYGPSGTEISSVFTPSNNASGGFVGFEGLDPSGLSETSYDDHSGTPHGILANIYVGAPVSLVPEPRTWAMMLMGFFGLGAILRGARRRLGLIEA